MSRSNRTCTFWFVHWCSATPNGTCYLHQAIFSVGNLLCIKESWSSYSSPLFDLTLNAKEKFIGQGFLCNLCARDEESRLSKFVIDLSDPTEYWFDSFHRTEESWSLLDDEQQWFIYEDLHRSELLTDIFHGIDHEFAFSRRECLVENKTNQVFLRKQIDLYRVSFPGWQEKNSSLYFSNALLSDLMILMKLHEEIFPFYMDIVSGTVVSHTDPVFVLRLADIRSFIYPLTAILRNSRK